MRYSRQHIARARTGPYTFAMTTNGMNPGPSPCKTDVVIVGAGPVGLLTANLLGARGATVTLLEREHSTTIQSRAIGITPPSLEILEDAGLLQRFLTEGLPIRRAVVHGTRRRLGELRFDAVHERFPFILSIPQLDTMNILRDGLSRFGNVTVRYGCTATGVTLENSGKVVVHFRNTADAPAPNAANATNAAGMTEHSLSAQWCVAADGVHSQLARGAGLHKHTARYNVAFLMGDFRDNTGLGDVAHLWFTRYGAVESFPLPKGVRRWIVQYPPHHDGTPLEDLIRRRSGVDVSRSDRLWESSFRPAWSEAVQFFQPAPSRSSRSPRAHIFLAGDAAHSMSPIGGQGMNTGFADAEFLTAVAAGNVSPAGYQRARRRAGRAATRRASAGMRIGTVRGPLRSWLRNGLVALVLGPLVRGHAARHFAMLTIPRGRFTRP